MNASNGIYVTLGAAQLKEKPYRQQLKNFDISDGERAFFCWRLKNRPKREFVDVFIIIANKVRFRAKFIGYDDRGEITFLDGETMASDNWLQLIDFVKLPKPYQEMKGFQGFRYKE